MKPTDIVQAGVRIRESLPRDLEKEFCKAPRFIQSGSASMRLQDSFKKDVTRSIESVAADLAAIQLPRF